MKALHALWEDSLRLYQLGQWRQAGAGFRRYLEELPQDRPARHLLRLSRQRARESGAG
jgi:hypothetical protein